jgi:SPP1 family predicted phage head-tail adaptor
MPRFATLQRHRAIGARRHRVLIEQPFEMPDAEGGVARTYIPLASDWAAFEAVTGDETAREDMAISAALYRVTLAWRSDVTPAMRLLCDGRRYLILATADPDGCRTQLSLLTEELS